MNSVKKLNFQECNFLVIYSNKDLCKRDTCMIKLFLITKNENDIKGSINFNPFIFKNLFRCSIVSMHYFYFLNDDVSFKRLE